MVPFVKSFIRQLASRSSDAPIPGAPHLTAARGRVGWIGASGLVLLGLLALNPVLGQRLAQESFDLLFRFRSASAAPPTPQDLIVVRMDDDSRRTLGQRREYVWDRALHARLIDSLAAAGSRTVVVDLLLAEPTTEDEQLGRALARHGKVVVSANLTRRGLDGLGEVEDLETPEPAIATNAAAVALLNVVVGRDGVVRRLLAGRRSEAIDGGWEPSLSWAAADLELRNLAAQRGAPRANLWLNYYGPPNTLPSISYVDALKPESAPRLRDRIVVVGANFDVDFPGTRKDTFPTPYGAGRMEIPGLELHATALLNLVRGEWLQRVSAPLEAGLVIVFGLAFGFGLPRLRPMAALAVCVLLAGAISWASLAAGWHLRHWWSWLVPVAIQIPVGLIWASATNLLLLGQEKELFRRSLATYLPPRVVEELVSRPESLRLGGQVRPIVILFTDITDFSRLSQRTDPRELVALLNEYYDISINCVHEADGTVLGILGDGLFAVWNAPVEQPEPERQALEAAFALIRRLRAFEHRPGKPAIRTRIGLHRGEACVGNFGSTAHFSYTAIGDAVNLASRLNGLNKHLETEILVSRDFQQGLTGHAVRSLGFFRFKGFDQAVEVFEPRTAASASRVLAEAESAFREALRHFHAGNLMEALEEFDRSGRADPEDGVARFYAARLRALAGGPLPPGGSVIELDSK